MLLVTLLIILVSIISLRLAITLNRFPVPQAALVLEGDSDRIRFAAQFLRSYPALETWISGNPGGFDFNRSIFQQSGIPDQQVHYDFCATDTVTNFTCTVKDFTVQDIRHLYLITSDYHMARSRTIATLVLGSRGIAVTPVPVPSKRTQLESPIRTLRDCIRSLVWIVTGWSGASFNPHHSGLTAPAKPTRLIQ